MKRVIQKLNRKLNHCDSFMSVNALFFSDTHSAHLYGGDESRQIFTRKGERADLNRAREQRFKSESPSSCFLNFLAEGRRWPLLFLFFLLSLLKNY